MKQTLLILLVIALALFSSCKKTPKSLTLNGGSWTINTTTYNAVGCTDSGGIVYSTNGLNQGNNNFGECIVQLGANPVSNTTYSVVNDSVAVDVGLNANQAYILATSGAVGSGILYHSPNTGTVSASVSATGKVTISGSGIVMSCNCPPSDSVILSFNLTQTN
jgi:hypothetical protein